MAAFLIVDAILMGKKSRVHETYWLVLYHVDFGPNFKPPKEDVDIKIFNSGIASIASGREVTSFFLFRAWHFEFLLLSSSKLYAFHLIRYSTNIDG